MLGSVSATAQNPRPQSPAKGITGVPRYRAGIRGPRGTAAPAATGSVATVGDLDANGQPDDSIMLPGMPALLHNSLGIQPGTPIQVRVKAPVDSGHAKNGDMIQGTLVEPVGKVPAGAPVELTVVATAAAGQMTSVGELSVQIVRINGENALSQVITAMGQESKRDLADTAPKRGTEAILTPDKPLTLPAA